MPVKPNNLRNRPNLRGGYGRRGERRRVRRDLRQSPHCLSETGLAIFRTVDERQLEPTFDAMFSSIGNLLLNHRLNFDQMPPAISLVELKEAPNQVLLKNTPTEEAIAAVHTEVPTLQKPITVRPTGLVFLSRSSARKSLSITLSPEDNDMLTAERHGALEAIEGLAIPGASDEYGWYREKAWHISLGYVAAIHFGQITPEALEPVLAALPEQVRARRATYYARPGEQ